EFGTWEQRQEIPNEPGSESPLPMPVPWDLRAPTPELQEEAAPSAAASSDYFASATRDDLNPNSPAGLTSVPVDESDGALAWMALSALGLVYGPPKDARNSRSYEREGHGLSGQDCI